MAEIQVSVNQDRIEIPETQIEKVVEKILDDLGYTDSEVSIVIVDDHEMRRLNKQYRDVDDATDVLAFPMLEGEASEVYPQILGDVVISAATAQDMAETYNCPFGVVLDLLLVHGILHLVGYDHGTPAEAQNMDGKTIELMGKLGHTDEELDWYATSTQECDTPKINNAKKPC